MSDDQPKTGVNKEWAQSELTKKVKKDPIDIHNIPADATIPQIEEKIEFQKSLSMFVLSPAVM